MSESRKKSDSPVIVAIIGIVVALITATSTILVALIQKVPPESIITNQVLLNLPKVTISPPQGKYQVGTKIILHTDAGEADIFYTLDRSIPDSGSNRYFAPFALERDTTVRAVVIKKGGAPSEVSTSEYKTFDASSQTWDKSTWAP